jgi:hypothetical protein
MSKEQLQALLNNYLASFRSWEYSRLAQRVEQDRQSHECLDHTERRCEDGTVYYIESQALWDDCPGGDVRVIASISVEPQRRLFGFLPIDTPDLTDSFIMSPDGRFVDE